MTPTDTTPPEPATAADMAALRRWAEHAARESPPFGWQGRAALALLAELEAVRAERDAALARERLTDAALATQEAAVERLKGQVEAQRAALARDAEVNAAHVANIQKCAAERDDLARRLADLRAGLRDDRDDDEGD